MADVGRQIQVRIAASRPLRGRPSPRLHGRGRKGVDWWPADPHEFLAGGMSKIEWLAGQRARDEAIRNEREFWLPRLESWREEHRDDPRLRAALDQEINRLRRTLGIKQRTPDEIREQTRRRVQAYRKRQRLHRTDYRPLPSPA